VFRSFSSISPSHFAAPITKSWTVFNNGSTLTSPFFTTTR
jgi:hypothetical protein